MKQKKFSAFFLLIACALPICLSAPLFTEVPQQKPDIQPMSVDRIFKDREFRSQYMGQSKWTTDGNGYTMLQSSATMKDARDLVRIDLETGETQVLVPATALVPEGGEAALSIEDYAWSSDGKLLIYTNTQRVWRDNTKGDYWVLNQTDGTLRQLGGDATPGTLMFAKFSPDGNRVAYVRENNIYVEDLASGIITPLTTDGSPTTINGTFDWVYEEELGLQDGFRWSPDGTSIAYWQLDASGVRNFLMINNTDDLYSRTIPVQYPKTGETNSAARIGVVSSGGGETRWFRFDGDPRQHYLVQLEWAVNSDEVCILRMPRNQQAVTAWLANARTGNLTRIFSETEDAWLEPQDMDVRWSSDGTSFLWLSERDGWRHLYRYSRDGKDVQLLTPGDYDVTRIAKIDEAGDRIYFMASPDDPTARYLFMVPLSGGKATRITPADQEGTHRYRISTDGKHAFQTFSSFMTAPITRLVSLPDHAIIRSLVDNRKLNEKLQNGLTPVTWAFFRVPTGDGPALDAWALYPPNFDPTKKYPVLFYVYGEPGAQTVRNTWGRNYTLWHRLLAEQGYVIISMDNRGTPSPRGRAFRKCVYGQIGVLSSQDQANGLKSLMKQHSWIDPERIGIWGWSGGGSMTLNMMFRYPELYKVGISIAPVANQRYYDSIYQERYMGLPAENPDGYKAGSPITHAAGLTGKLLLIHGTGDDNVHYQNTEALINELVASHKFFDLMIYPNRSHGLYERENMPRHLYATMLRYLLEHLPVNPAD